MLFPANIGPIIISILPLKLGLNPLHSAIFSVIDAGWELSASSKEVTDDYFERVRSDGLPLLVAVIV